MLPPAWARAAASASQINLTWTDNATDETSFEIERSTSSTFSNATTLTAGAGCDHVLRRLAAPEPGLPLPRARKARQRGVGVVERRERHDGPRRARRDHRRGVEHRLERRDGRRQRRPEGVVDQPLVRVPPDRLEQRVRRDDAVDAGSGRGDVAASATLANLQPSTQYTFRVVAQSPGGTSRGSDVQFTTAAQPDPSAPATLGATAASSSQINLSWNDTSDDETGFEIQRDTTASFSSPATLSPAPGANAETFQSTGLDPNQAYHYRVRAKRGSAASGWSNVATATTNHAAPGATTGAASNVAWNAATVAGSVDPKGSATTRFFEYRPTGSTGAFSTTPAVDAGSGRGSVAASANLTGLQPSTEYTFRVVAQSAGGTTRGSDATFTTAEQPPPNPPASLGATAASPSQINLTWDDASNDETSFEIQRDTTSSFSSPATLTAGANAESLQSAGLDPNRTYHYRVRARRGSAASAWSNTDDATTQSIAPTVEPAAEAIDVTQNSATLGGTVNPNGAATTYRFEYGTTPAYGSRAPNPDDSVGSDRDAVPVFVDVSGLQPDTTYHYRLVARNEFGQETATAGQTFKTPNVPPPATPSALSATAVSPTRVDLTWSDDSTDETRFEIERGDDDFDTAANVEALADETVVAGTSYSYRIRAVGPGGPSAWSATVDVTTPTPSVPGGGDNDPPQTGNPNVPSDNAGDTNPPGPGPGPGPGPESDPPADRAAPRSSFTLPVQTLGDVIRRGLTFKLKLNEPGTVTTRVLVAPSVLGKRSRQALLVIGRGDKNLAQAGTASVRIKLSSTARRLLKRRKSVKLWIETSAKDRAGNRARTTRKAVVIRAKAPAARR